MIEVIQRDNKKLRFNDNCFYEYEKDWDCVKIFEEKNDEVTKVATIFSPIRVDEVDIYTTLCAPIYTLEPNIICNKCCQKQS